MSFLGYAPVTPGAVPKATADTVAKSKQPEGGAAPAEERGGATAAEAPKKSPRTPRTSSLGCGLTRLEGEPLPSPREKGTHWKLVKATTTGVRLRKKEPEKEVRIGDIPWTGQRECAYEGIFLGLVNGSACTRGYSLDWPTRRTGRGHACLPGVAFGTPVVAASRPGPAVPNVTSL
eukprot:1187172-Prorocentrum_minimum.AAC.1